MNKLLIVLLPVCLFSVVRAHSSVKRDAPTADNVTPTAPLTAMKDKVTEIGTNIGKQIAEAFQPDVIKKNVNDLIDAATKAMDKLKPVVAATPAEDAKPAA